MYIVTISLFTHSRYHARERRVDIVRRRRWRRKMVPVEGTVPTSAPTIMIR